jgi:two-component system, chemotaxis family, chemotaxis protein CheY
MSKTILTVDDSPSIRSLVRVTLQEAGYSVIEGFDGQDGLEKATTSRVDAIIVDQNMPRMDGISMIRALRRHPNGQGVPVVVLSTESEDNLKQQARDAGALGWMVKPFTQDKLLAVMRKVVGP